MLLGILKMRMSSPLSKRSVRQCERKWRVTRLDVHRDIFISRLKYCRRCDKLKRDYHRNRIENSDTKGLFAIADELTGTKKCRAMITPTNVPSDQLCDVFALFFQGKVERLRKGLIPDFHSSLSGTSHLFTDFSPLTTEDVV